eukprot:CAMPEP_0170221460 /NCGR_PEP_ID=MMETSP0116_2-20130129/10419_1 /TAXON_ID=400756 /ORGANISM="Durinskia baltica, Strain CSIRO CS-38" /LENGTH=625 /DNA_ID=CAMNT_0010472141 /DNA_START=45 /DNA_END=1922 /DNA_ORIENTATION=+
MKEVAPNKGSPAPLFAPDGSQGNIARVGLNFIDVGYVVTKKKAQVTVLSNVSGACESGEVLFLMGPSGAGKTTLLDCLGGRVKGKPMGEVFLGGKPATPEFRRRVMQYCMESPPFHEALTVEECLMVAARLCCACRAEARRRVEWVLSVLGLESCRKTLVGGMLYRGISTGQKKRLGMGEKVLVGAPVLFLDEPTSGLDASSALQTAGLLRVLAAQNSMTIICSIHQPSERVLSCADKVLLLATGGKQVYYGNPKGIEQHFRGVLGEVLTPSATPAEWVLEMISLEVGGPECIDRCALAWAKEGTAQKVKPARDMEKSTTAWTEANPDRVHAAPREAARSTPLLAPFRHTAVLFHRSMLNTVRNPLVVWVRMGMYVALSIVIATVWWDIGKDLKAGDVDDLAAILFFIAAFQAFMSVSSMPSFLEDRTVYIKEKASGNYGVIAYNVGALLASTPFVFLIAVVCSTIIYFSLALNPDGGKFVFFILNLFLTLVCAEAVVFLVATICPIFIVSLAASAFIFGTFMIFQGFFIRRPNIPIGWRWAHWLGFHSYSFRNALYNEFDGRIVLKDLSVYPPVTENFSGEAVIANFDFQDEDLTTNCIIMVAMIVGYRLIAAIWQQFFHTGLK